LHSFSCEIKISKIGVTYGGGDREMGEVAVRAGVKVYLEKSSTECSARGSKREIGWTLKFCVNKSFGYDVGIAKERGKEQSTRHVKRFGD